jgi:hypothetical protein
MAVTAREVLNRVVIDLHDTDHVRWPLYNLNLYISDGLTQIASAKPTAFSKTVTLDLAEGVEQTLPDDVASILRVIANKSAAGIMGRAVTPIERHQLDLFWPHWQDPRYMPYSAEVQHVSYDPASPRTFLVFPGNTGTGKITATVASGVVTVTKDVGTEGTKTDHYTMELGIDDAYRSTLVNYVLYRAFTPDQDTPQAAQRANAYLQLFTADLGQRAQNEATQTPDSITQPGA